MDTTTNLANMLKIYYDELYDKEQMEVHTSMYSQISKNKDVDGKEVEASFQVARNNGIVSTAYTNSTEPVAQSRQYENPKVTPKFLKAAGAFQQQLVSWIYYRSLLNILKVILISTVFHLTIFFMITIVRTNQNGIGFSLEERKINLILLKYFQKKQSRS